MAFNVNEVRKSFFKRVNYNLFCNFLNCAFVSKYKTVRQYMVGVYSVPIALA